MDEFLATRKPWFLVYNCVQFGCKLCTLLTTLNLCVLVSTTQASFEQGKLPMAPLSEPVEKHWQRGKLPISFFLNGTGITLAAVVPRFVVVVLHVLHVIK